MPPPTTMGDGVIARSFASGSSNAADGIIRYSEKRLVNFKREVMFGVIADVERYESFLPWCTESRVLHRFGPNRFDAQLCVGFKLASASYVSRVELVPHSAIMVKSHSSPILQSLSNDWTFTDGAEPNTTLVSFDVAFQFKSSLHTQAARIFFQEVHSRMLSAFLDRAAQISHKSIRIH